MCLIKSCICVYIYVIQQTEMLFMGLNEFNNISWTGYIFFDAIDEHLCPVKIKKSED